MIITIESNSSEYQIKPLDNGLCYQIFKKNSKNKLAPTGKYASSIPDAMRLIVDLVLKDPDDNTNKVEIKKLNQAAKTIDDTIKKVIDNLVVTVLNNIE